MANMYGNYASCSEEDVAELKSLLAGEMMEMIRQLTEMDDFWEITRVPDEEKHRSVKVSYKICIPQMRKGKSPFESCCDHCPNRGADTRGDGDV